MIRVGLAVTAALVGAAAYALTGSSGLLVVTVLAGVLALLAGVRPPCRSDEWLTRAPAERARPDQVAGERGILVVPADRKRPQSGTAVETAF